MAPTKSATKVDPSSFEAAGEITLSGPGAKKPKFTETMRPIVPKGSDTLPSQWYATGGANDQALNNAAKMHGYKLSFGTSTDGRRVFRFAERLADGGGTL